MTSETLVNELKRRLGVEIERYNVSRDMLTRLQEEMNSHASAEPNPCNFDAAFRYVDRCDQKCTLYAIKDRGRFYGFMILRKGLKPDLRWDPSPQAVAAGTPFPGFYPRWGPSVHPDEVLDILVLCSHGGRAGLGQLLVLYALTLAKHGVFLQMSIRVETVQSLVGDDPEAQLTSDLTYLVTNYVVLEAARHIYTKFGFHPVEVHTAEGRRVGGIFYFREQPLTSAELKGYLDHLQHKGVVVPVPSLAAPAQPPPGPPADWPGNTFELPLNGVSGGGASSSELQDWPYAGLLTSLDDDRAQFGYPDGLGGEVPVFGIDESGALADNDNLASAAAAGPTQLDSHTLPSDTRLGLVATVASRRPKGRSREPKEKRSSRRQKEWVCDVCGQKLTTKQNRERHMIQKHPVLHDLSKRDPYVKRRPDEDLFAVGEQYKCPICHKSFVGRTDNLKRHIFEVHQPEKDERRRLRDAAACNEFEGCGFKCQQCGTLFHGKYAQTNWRRHIRTLHPPLAPVSVVAPVPEIIRVEAPALPAPRALRPHRTLPVLSAPRGPRTLERT